MLIQDAKVIILYVRKFSCYEMALLAKIHRNDPSLHCHGNKMSRDFLEVNDEC